MRHRANLTRQQIATYRRQKGSGRDKLLRAFKDNVGKILTTQELRSVYGKECWNRRVRELANEWGYQISTQTNCSSLRRGQYVLTSKTPQKEHPETRQHITPQLRRRLLERAEHCCEHVDNHGRRCSATHNLQLDHRVPFSVCPRRGDDMGDWQVLCQQHNIAKSNFWNGKTHRPLLMPLLMVSSRVDKETAYQWLRDYFEMNRVQRRKGHRASSAVTAAVTSSSSRAVRVCRDVRSLASSDAANGGLDLAPANPPAGSFRAVARKNRPPIQTVVYLTRQRIREATMAR